MSWLIPAALTLAVSLALPIAVTPLLRALGIVDVPNERSSHDRTAVRGMGLAVLLAFLAGIVVAVALAPAELFVRPLLVVAAGALAAGLLGLSEDFRGLPVLARSLAQLAIALGVCLALLPGSGLSPLLAVGFVLYGLLFLSSFINVANFMDGLNGISGLHGVVAGVTFAIAGQLSGLPWLLAVGAVLAAAFAGFLPWNLSGRLIFLGDVGSYLLGGAVAATSLAALLAGVPVLATIGPMILYFGDSATTLVTRVRAGEKWYEPHKEHAYQRINQAGFSHLGASLIVAGMSAVACALGLLSYAIPAPYWWLLLLAGIALTALYLAIPGRLEKRHARVA